GSFFFSSRRGNPRCSRDWSPAVSSPDLRPREARTATAYQPRRPPAAGTRRYSGAPPLPAPPGPPAQRGRERDRRPSRRGRVEHPVPLAEPAAAAPLREPPASPAASAAVSASLLPVDPPPRP